jgi:two-component system, OmpR family, sensor histidine kinase MprB
VSLRTRIAAVSSLAVALAVLAAAVGLYLAVRSDLRGQIDESLNQRARGVLALSASPRAVGFPGGRFPGAIPQRAEPPPDGSRAGQSTPGPFPRAVAPARFGGATGYLQLISPQGVVNVPAGQGSSPRITPSAHERAIAVSGQGRELSDRTVKGTHLRVLTLGNGAQGAVQIARPLAEVDHELSRILLILLLVGVAGIAIAALLGALIARTALTPIVRFTRRTEALTGAMDLSERLEVSGRDELARLAASFNATLDALERSLAAQRQLIADASHELRTPIASLRANVQILEDSGRLPPEEQESLHQDILDELDELTSLVSDVVELARGARGDAAHEDVRLDQIVAEAVARTRRRAELRFELQLEPTLVSGEGDEINRAVSNLLENARKWSPPDGLIEVGLSDGVLTVRDHGPGFQEDELGMVFERFYRAEGARKLPGSGLGLAIVRQAAEAHHGFSKAENAPGGGALLRVSFGPPVALAESAEMPAALPQN